MRDRLKKIFSLLGYLKLLPRLIRFLFKQKIKFPYVLILILVFFYLGSALSNGILTSSQVQKIPLSFFQDFDSTKISVTEAQLANSVKVSQKSAPAPVNKRYLVVFTTVENASSSAKQVTYGDYFRLEEDAKKLAPLPINVNFVIPPKATLEKQLIFIIDQNKKAFNLLVGPIDKEPQQIQLNF